MTPLYLLDTNALSEPIKPAPHPGFLRRFRTHRERLAVAATTWHEALFGLYRLPAGRRRNEIEEYLVQVIGGIPVLPYDRAAADWHARERARLAARGRAASFADGQIAAIAATHELTVVTRNVKDFRIFSAVAVENWAG